ncbi:MAG: hypothetical protein HN674_04210 [Candidatus Marinimicrobia bacterium]|jgi:hypothetical protein|nr:hypothetical protein [Candidatus Neomarinimicrobiota bacterium]MBT3839881.1 hypothetical protein [Candidatus Neomarinimicrobiota bacterium]MBT3999612.1 hypothetical protein [Candidatus Neomarinimicrobiota bacterium]MBT4383294.1 hypothetical protein [Candidatus Neomarinimicrobiota bacterium]MBT4580013.1 hypothetical protein [Candidatus Neomarinimicrobiota bacterium]
MKKLFPFLLFLTTSWGQSYTVKILGVLAADVEQTVHDSGMIEFKTQNRGLFDLIWPVNNVYIAQYDSNSFALKSWNKRIKQGEFTQNISAKMDFLGFLAYDENTLIETPKPIHTIFTLLAMVQSRSYDKLDSKWFNYEQEGLLGQARFVWADSSNTWNGKDSTLCDHYRLDIKINDTSRKIEKQTDYFLAQMISEDTVKEMWVSRALPKKIIKAQLKTTLFPVIATINE